MQVPTSVRWNPAKAEANLRKHKVAFDFVLKVFADPELLVQPTIRIEDGEERYKAIGDIDGKLYVVIFTMREGAHRLISARRTNSKEESDYARHRDQV
jgi:uncharacterized DUF497 family protein